MKRLSTLALVLAAIAFGPNPCWAEPAGLGQATKSGSSEQIGQTARVQVVEALARELAAKYAVESTGQKMAFVILGKLRTGAYDKIASARAMAAALQDDVHGVDPDLHLQVMFDPAWRPPGQAPAPDWKKLAGGVLAVEILDGNVGYLKIGGFPPASASRDAIAAAFVLLHNTDSLIIDELENHGGDPACVALLMSYLVDGPPIVVNTLRFRKDGDQEDLRTTEVGEATFGARKPVFILVSGRTFSGGEALAYDLQAMKRALVVGQTTPGGANPTAPTALGHGFVAFIPYARATSPVTQGSWEGVGVRPDIAAPPDQALATALRLAKPEAKLAPSP